jgi:hypothetical protein
MSTQDGCLASARHAVTKLTHSARRRQRALLHAIATFLTLSLAAYCLPGV